MSECQLCLKNLILSQLCFDLLFFRWGAKLKHINFVSRIWLCQLCFDLLFFLVGLETSAYINFVSRIWWCQLCFDRPPWASLELELKHDKSFRASFHCSFQLWAHNDNTEKLAPIDRHDQRVFGVSENGVSDKLYPQHHIIVLIFLSIHIYDYSL